MILKPQHNNMINPQNETKKLCHHDAIFDDFFPAIAVSSLTCLSRLVLFNFLRHNRDTPSVYISSHELTLHAG